MKAVRMNDMGMTQGIGISGVSAGEEKGNNKKDGQVKNGTVFAGGLGGMTTDRIEQRRQQAKTQAGKLIMDQFAADNELTDAIQEHRDRIKDLSAERSKLLDLRKESADGREALKEKYEVTPDSQEQKDLELVRKARDLTKVVGMSGMLSMSKEELSRLGEMGPLTEYQEQALAFDDVLDFCDSQIKNIDDEIMTRGRAIYGIRQGMLKRHGMADAKKAAGDAMDAASSDMIGMMMEDARKYIDEEMKKLRETAKEAAEKKEENKADEERKAEEEKEEREKLTKSIKESVSGKDTIRQEVDKILEKAKALCEAKFLWKETKGIVVDSQV